MKMFLFLNESYIFDRLRMWSTVYGTHVYSYAQNVRMPIIGVPRCCLENPLLRLRSFRFRSKRKSEFRFKTLVQKLIV
ncbi:ADS_G0046970.mRNA.1.CDS.1 [Saccharomyces cerevisiae]|nr:ADS_G0046970.mRNA.1.CDS.1 [Saccharomyces cerevisiae]CAI6868592.1 ADS_G0046970.mRNA.1.CDS.1 [Saccharomyces cerevisiae]